MEIKQAKKWAAKNGFEIYDYFYNADGTAKALIISTDYSGKYAPAEIYLLHDSIRRKAKRAGMRAESSPSHVCVYVHLDPVARLNEFYSIYSK